MTYNNTFYRVWFPVSLLLHAALLAIFSLVMFNANRDQSPETYTTVIIDRIEDTKPAPTTPPIAIAPQNSAPTAVTQPGTQLRDPDNGHTETPNNDPFPARSKIDSAPPKLMTGQNTNEIKAPPGKDKGTGTVGTGTLPSGPTNGASAQPGGPNPTYPKLALEEGQEGTVVVTVHISPLGTIEGEPTVATSSGYDQLDRTAQRAARSWRFTPAQTNGEAVSGTVKIQFTFAHGAVEGKPL